MSWEEARDDYIVPAAVLCLGIGLSGAALIVAARQAAR
jgi:hypothetical protein